MEVKISIERTGGAKFFIHDQRAAIFGIEFAVPTEYLPELRDALLAAFDEVIPPRVSVADQGSPPASAAGPIPAASGSNGGR